MVKADPSWYAAKARNRGIHAATRGRLLTLGGTMLRGSTLVPKLRVWERKHRGEAVLRGEGLVEERSAFPPPATQWNCARKGAFPKPHFGNEGEERNSGRIAPCNSISPPWPASTAARRCARFDEDGNQDQLASDQNAIRVRARIWLSESGFNFFPDWAIALRGWRGAAGTRGVE